MLEVRDIRYHVGKKEILRGIDTRFEAGLFHVIVGPNGCGKSTFLKIFSGELVPSKGIVLYEGANISDINKTKLAQTRAVMSQQPELHFPLTVKEIVLMGRYPHFSLRPSHLDLEICWQAMVKMEVSDFAERDYLTLSGGEKQRVQFARVLSQIWEAEVGLPKFLFLDEAVSHLDLRHQQQLLHESKQLSRRGSTVICILHDLNLAVSFADRMLFMKNGRIVHELDNPSEINPIIIREVFEIEAEILRSADQRPVIAY